MATTNTTDTKREARRARQTGARERDGKTMATIDMEARGAIGCGWLCDYDDATRIRRATPEEANESREAARTDGGAGIIRVNGRRCYVEAS